MAQPNNTLPDHSQKVFQAYLDTPDDSEFTFPSLKGHEDFATEREKPKYNAVEIIDDIKYEDLNLETELLQQYNTARRLLNEATLDTTVPLNQKAQVINSATSILGALIKSQAELYSMERVKKIEAILLKVLKDFPKLQAPFMEAYREALEG